MSGKQVSAGGNFLLQLDQEEDRQSSNRLSYSTMVAKMEEEQQIHPASAHPSGSEFYEILQNDGDIPINKPYDSTGLPRGDRPVHVPFDFVMKNSQPKMHDYQEPHTTKGLLPPRNPAAKNNFDILPRRNTEPVIRGGKQFGLGDKIVNSVLKNEKPQEVVKQVIEQGSLIMDDSEGSSSMSHFEPVKFQSDDEQEKKEDKDIVIKTSQVKQHELKRADSLIQLRQTDRGFQGNTPERDSSPESKPSRQEIKQIKKLSLKNEKQESPAIMVSRIIRKGSQQAAVMKPLIIAQKKQEEEQKMVHTYGPKQVDSAYKKASVNGGNSEPNRRSPSRQPSSKNQAFSNFESQRQPSNAPAESIPDYNKIINDKVNEIMLMLNKQQQQQQPSQVQAQEQAQLKNQLANAFAHQFNLNQEHPSMKKIEELNKIVSGDLFGNVSQIRNQERQPKISSQQGFIQQLPIREHDIQQNTYQPETVTMRPNRPHKIAVNFKDYSQEPPSPPLGRAPSPRWSSRHHRRQEEEQYTVSDEEFELVQNSMPHIPRTPRVNDPAETLTDLGIQAFESLNIRPDDYHSMDVDRSRQGVVFELNKGPFIIWEYQGRFFFGHKKGRKINGQYQRQGEGVEIVPGVSYYEGEFSRNMKNGYGTSISKNGDKYRGYWKNDLPHGRGKLCTSVSRYEGDFVSGVKQGEGFQLFSNGDSYDGNYFENKFHGQGKYVWKNKTFYEGEFKRHYMDGQGYWRSTNGDTYEGEYFKSMKHGWGRYRWSNGRVFEGRFEHGHRVDGKVGPKMTIAVERELTYDLGSYEDSQRFEVKLDRLPNKRYTIRDINSISEDRKSPRRNHYRQI